MKLPIHERFHTFQGEGVHMGRSAFFIRTFGCPLHCPWCDSAGTWHKDYVPEHVQRIEVDQLVDEAVACKPSFVVVTGGEPTIHDLRSLTSGMHLAKLRVHLETSGAFPIQGSFDWVTVSPKDNKAPLVEVLGCADEFKIIVSTPGDIWKWVEACNNSNPNAYIWLHPEWSKRTDPIVLTAISNAVKGHNTLRAGWQMHKLYRCDQLDYRTAPLVPLGGNPALGY